MPVIGIRIVDLVAVLLVIALAILGLIAYRRYKESDQAFVADLRSRMGFAEASEIRQYLSGKAVLRRARQLRPDQPSWPWPPISRCRRVCGHECFGAIFVCICAERVRLLKAICPYCRKRRTKRSAKTTEKHPNDSCPRTLYQSALSFRFFNPITVIRALGLGLTFAENQSGSGITLVKEFRIRRRALNR